MRLLHWFGWGGLLALPLVAGCGTKPQALAAVRGQVFFHGQPLAGGTIVFTPDPERGGRGPLACGEIGPDGRYELHTDGTDGAIVGWHRVTVAAHPPAAAAGAETPPPLPARYSDPDAWGECREVKPGQVNTHDFRLD